MARCCEAGCGYAAIYLDRCFDHVKEYRRKLPAKARRDDEAVLRAERARLNVIGKKLLSRLKEGHHGQGQDT